MRRLEYITPPEGQASVWEGLSHAKRRMMVSMLVIGSVQFLLVDIYFRYQQLSYIQQYLAGGSSGAIPGDGILYPPLLASLLVYSVLVASVVLQIRTRGGNSELAWLGSAWVLASIPLLFDFLIDTFELKVPVAFLFLYAGFRYWKGSRNNPLSFVLAPLVTLIAAADGMGHLSGSFCQSSGLDSCSAKAVSDTYLVIMLLALMYFTLRGRDKRPSLRLILITVGIPIAAFVLLALTP